MPNVMDTAWLWAWSGVWAAGVVLLASRSRETVLLYAYMGGMIYPRIYHMHNMLANYI